MKASELRIGNYIENTDSQMASYMVVNADVIKQNEHTMYASFEPIQLTEEWLLKFGYQIGMFWILSTGEFRINISGIHYDIQYVHQLQNLYFALTGEELTLKP